MDPLKSSGGHWAARCRQENGSKPLYLVIKLKSGLQMAKAHGTNGVNFTGLYSGPADLTHAHFQMLVRRY